MIKFLGSVRLRFQCRTRLCGWCSGQALFTAKRAKSFNAARGFVGGATGNFGYDLESNYVFQCRTRLGGWCSKNRLRRGRRAVSFNAARGLVGGAASSLAALVPLGGKSSFGKSPEI